MSKIRLYLDEDTPRKALIKALRNAGFDLITTSEANNLSQSDDEQLIWATQQSRVIYTYNAKDFCRLHSIYMAEERTHTGIIVSERQSYSVGVQLRAIERLISTLSAAEIINQLVFLGTYIQEN
ncbi:DUF5615 family PIN-like protein [Ancylothrix sp. C2]|uniref:DUF5615 family PIN-like protein n=1 Tax=Ancylothrix sp. D3o TaxID=2953691 RepID=UPI0021BBA88B|nr:DUF5615 family PIN-like protein [Ancylothrix sp. D3o]MCT7951841.1 DUF5615 family PIN-like protein [Ancylothrix sp. D3o]